MACGAQSAPHRWSRRAGLPLTVGSVPPKTPIDDHELRRLYVDEGLSLEDVARHAGCAASTVALRLARLGVKIRDRGRPSGHAQVDRDRLLQLYVADGLGLHAVAAKLHVGRSAVAHALDELGVPRHAAGRPRHQSDDVTST